MYVKLYRIETDNKIIVTNKKLNDLFYSLGVNRIYIHNDVPRLRQTMYRYFNGKCDSNYFIKILRKRLKDYTIKKGGLCYEFMQKKHPKIDVEYRSIVAISRYIVLKSSVLKEIQS